MDIRVPCPQVQRRDVRLSNPTDVVHWCSCHTMRNVRCPSCVLHVHCVNNEHAPALRGAPAQHAQLAHVYFIVGHARVSALVYTDGCPPHERCCGVAHIIDRLAQEAQRPGEYTVAKRVSLRCGRRACTPAGLLRLLFNY